MKRKEFSFGGCNFEELSPSIKKLSCATKMLNIRIPFEEALKLNLALDECIRKLNALDRRYKEGKKAAVNLAVNFIDNRITVYNWSGKSK